MVLRIGVDDTDSLRGMCTTFLATELVRDLTKTWDLIGFPRLVRLNPNIPWKTRGNGAICVRIGHGRGRPHVVGWIDGSEVRAFPHGEGIEDSHTVADRVAALVERWSRFEDPGTNPGFVVLRAAPPEHLYWTGVRSVLTMDEVLRGIGPGALVRPYKNGRGVIGAVAATAWRPHDRTYEILTYRREGAWGTHRLLSRESVIQMDRKFPSTFNNYDYEAGRIVLAPRTPCPVLFGIRGDDSKLLRPAMEMIRGEVPDRWLILETNQGTDDHVVRERPSAPHRTVRFRGQVRSLPWTIRGGHVLFSVDSHTVAAYEPSKGFRGIVRGLVPGDTVEIVGAVRPDWGTVNLEKLRVDSLAPVTRKVGNPVCPQCMRRAKSRGRGAGFRCEICRRHFLNSSAEAIPVPRTLAPGWYEPPAGSRRHLSLPLKRWENGSSPIRRRSQSSG
jgi:tRNA(Ile2)-agmatinylcytidine synthase